MGNYIAEIGERLPILERLYKERGLDIRPLKVNGDYFPMHTDYLFEKKKTYTVEPERGLTGQISSFPEKFFVPYFTVTYAVLPIGEYSKMMKALSVDEVTVEYYDTWENTYKTAKFYAQQPEMTKMQPMVFKKDDGSNEVKYGFIQNTTIIFAGTLNEISEYSVEFFANADDVVGTPPARITGYEGEEFKIPNKGTMQRNGYQFTGWKGEDGTTSYAVGSLQSFGTTSLKLFAQWSETTQYNLALSYGFDTRFIQTDKDTTASDGKVTVPTSIPVTYNQNISGLPISVDVLTIGDDGDYTILKDTSGNKVYTFMSWNKLPDGTGSTIANDTKYDVKGNSIANAIFSVRSYTITFYKEYADIAIGKTHATITDKYGTSFSVNEPKMTGYRRTGWYVKEKKTNEKGEVVKDENGNDVYEDVRFRASKIPAGNYTVFSKWEKEE